MIAQQSVRLLSGSERIIHGIRCCTDEHWSSSNFTILKTDLKMLLTLFPDIAVPDECCHHFPELYLQFWCCSYGQHPSPLDTISSESGVQQRDPMSSLLFCLVLQKIVSTIALDKACTSLLFHKWYIDDGRTHASRQLHLLRHLH